MKKHILIIAISLLGLSSVLHAQEAQKSKAKEKQAVLQLTTSQQSQIKELKQQHKAAEKAIKSNASLSEADKKKQLKAGKKAYKAKENAVLSPAQKSKLDSLKTTRKAVKKQKKH